MAGESRARAASSFSVSNSAGSGEWVEQLAFNGSFLCLNGQAPRLAPLLQRRRDKRSVYPAGSQGWPTSPVEPRPRLLVTVGAFFLAPRDLASTLPDRFVSGVTRTYCIAYGCTRYAPYCQLATVSNSATCEKTLTNQFDMPSLRNIAKICNSPAFLAVFVIREDRHSHCN